ncbi:MAG: SurA N-terminal domain-containing protein [Chlamydiales bacterium]|nr:SurA N-terminal domain-containing protein [Chlamydiales bacterium]
MKTVGFIWLALLAASPLSSYNDPSAGGMFSADQPQELIVYNRILAKAGAKTISVIDVMKKMDLFLQRYYPQYVDSKSARYQYYTSQWKETLNQMIDQELMLADAEHLELKIADAEVREEMLERFGPAIMQTLDRIGLTYEEARQMVFSEMVVQRIMWYRVNSKALNNVHPQDIKRAYEAYCRDNPALDEWEYQVLSLRSANRNVSETLAKRVCDLLSSARTDLAAVSEELKKEVTEDMPVAITLSSDFKADERSIAQSHMEVLRTLTPGAFSPPVAQVSRADQSIVYRIFHLKEHIKKELPTFGKVAEQLKDDLLQEAASKESVQYITRLRSRLGFDEKTMMEAIPDDFQPFALR